MTDYTEHLISMAGGDGDVMANVLRLHSVAGMSGGTHLACRCNKAWVTHADYQSHLHAELTAASVGKLP